MFIFSLRPGDARPNHDLSGTAQSYTIAAGKWICGAQ
jgi:hypothetical protein